MSDRLDEALERAERAEEHLAAIRRVVDAQAEDDALWFDTRYIGEAYLQQELRKLHDLVEACSAEHAEKLAKMREEKDATIAALREALETLAAQDDGTGDPAKPKKYEAMAAFARVVLARTPAEIAAIAEIAKAKDRVVEAAYAAPIRDQWNEDRCGATNHQVFQDAGDELRSALAALRKLEGS